MKGRLLVLPALSLSRRWNLPAERLACSRLLSGPDLVAVRSGNAATEAQQACWSRCTQNLFRHFSLLNEKRGAHLGVPCGTGPDLDPIAKGIVALTALLVSSRH